MPRKNYEFCIFLPEDEIARRVGMPLIDWRAVAKILEREGMVPIDPLMGNRYWPAVESFFLQRYGLVRVMREDRLIADGEVDLTAF